MADPIEEHIRKAQAEGQFDNLPGKGQPLRLEENPHEDPEWRLAHHLLQSSGFTLPWIELRKEIDAELEHAMLALKRSWQWQQTSHHQPLSVVRAEWQRAEASFREQVEQLNRKIRDYNLQTPSAHFQKQMVNAGQVLQEIRQSAQAEYPPTDDP
jgi:DnaJ family protein C protein 28